MADLEKITRKRLGEILVAEGMIHQDQLNEALKSQERTGELLGEALVKAGFTTETEIAKTLCAQFAKPFLKPSKYEISKEVLTLLPPKLLAEHQLVPVDRFGNLLVIAMAGLLDAPTLAQIQKLTGCEIEVYISTASDVKATLRKLYPDLYDPITMMPKFDMTAELTQGVKRPAYAAGETTSGTTVATKLPAGLPPPLKPAPKPGTPPVDKTEKTKVEPVDADELGINTAEIRAITAEEDGDWDALFEEAEQSVLKKFEQDDRDRAALPPLPGTKKKTKP